MLGGCTKAMTSCARQCPLFVSYSTGDEAVPGKKVATRKRKASTKGKSSRKQAKTPARESGPTSDPPADPTANPMPDATLASASDQSLDPPAAAKQNEVVHPEAEQTKTGQAIPPAQASSGAAPTESEGAPSQAKALDTSQANPVAAGQPKAADADETKPPPQPPQGTPALSATLDEAAQTEEAVQAMPSTPTFVSDPLIAEPSATPVEAEQASARECSHSVSPLGTQRWSAQFAVLQAVPTETSCRQGLRPCPYLVLEVSPLGAWLCTRHPVFSTHNKTSRDKRAACATQPIIPLTGHGMQRQPTVWK